MNFGKKSTKIFVIILIVLALGLILIFARGNEDTWLCQNGQWVKHGNPSAGMPSTGCEITR